MRIVSLSPSVTDTLVELGAGDELVGVSSFCLPYAPGKRIAGDYLKPRLDVIQELRPDLVFTSGEAQLPAARLLTAHGYRVVHIDIPASLHGVADMAWRIGVHIGRIREAEELSQKLHQRLARLHAAAKGARIAYIIDLGEPVSPAALSYAGHALTHLGATHPYQNRQAKWAYPTPEELEKHNPAIIVYEAKSPNPTHRLAQKRLETWRMAGLLARAKLLVTPVDTLAHYGPKLAQRLEKLAEQLKTTPTPP